MLLSDEDYSATMDELERLTLVVEALKDALIKTGVKPWIVEAIADGAYKQ